MRIGFSGTVTAAIMSSAVMLAGHAGVKAAESPQWIGPPANDAGDYVLTLGEVRFDPAVDMPLPPPGWDRSDDDPNGRNLRLIQFIGPTRQAWLDAVRAMDVEIVQYVHPYTYITWSTGNSRVAASKLPFVRWTGEFVPAYRVLPPYRNLDVNLADVRVMLYRGADCDAALAQIEAIGGEIVNRVAIDDTFETARVTIDPAMMRNASRVPGVYSIKPVPTDGGVRGEMTNQICADNINGSNIASPGYATWLGGIGLDGSGVVMANVDSGVQQSHPDLVNNMLGCVGVTCSTSDGNHGTHTAAIMAGDGASGQTANGGFLRGLGVAPAAQLFEQDYRTVFLDAGGMLLLMTDSYRNGAVLSNNSWGPAGSPRGYDEDTREVDVGVRDADPDMAGNQSLTYVLAFMNGYGGTSSQGTPDEAKNLFNIGSTKAQRNNGVQNPDINDVSVNSAHGPALDGRTIPHMVAPGCYVDSAITGSSYGLDCGTSMAAPHVAGAVALFFEYWRSLPTYSADPSPALIKAAFLPVCHNLSGQRDADDGVLGNPFDNKQGWGRMNMDDVVAPAPASVMYFDDPQVFGDTDETWTVQLEPVDPSQPMRMMLAWTDAPGHGLGGSTPAWNNDLDLIVEAGDTYFGNVFGGDGFSAAGGATDGMNNTEGVFLGPLPPPLITVNVKATNINSDGVPGNGDATDQDFAFVCYNCRVPDTSCTADITGEDDTVNLFDLLALLDNWGTNGPGADIAEPNDVVDLFDLLAMLDVWGACQ